MKWIDAPWIELLRIALEVAATVAFALSGVMMAARKRFDAVGVCVVAFVSAFGGGTGQQGPADLDPSQLPKGFEKFLGS